ncbi:hypothetical protein V6N11_064893 [Hibiscus sabdariffa]|uniref:Uncharacterized protein n=1 Tax=Hibiscus sabdariffa TaxID=183260 RepID=A0ABR2SIM8_9ROSI
MLFLWYDPFVNSWIWSGILRSSLANDTFGQIVRSNLTLQVGDASWIKAKFVGGSFSLKNLIAAISLTDHLIPIDVKTICVPCWVCPPKSFLKVNVDGVVSRLSSWGGIGSLLRDESGSTLLSFSKCVGVNAPALVELETVKLYWIGFGSDGSSVDSFGCG